MTTIITCYKIYTALNFLPGGSCSCPCLNQEACLVAIFIVPKTGQFLTMACAHPFGEQDIPTFSSYFSPLSPMKVLFLVVTEVSGTTWGGDRVLNCEGRISGNHYTLVLKSNKTPFFWKNCMVGGEEGGGGVGFVPHLHLESQSDFQSPSLPLPTPNTL